MIVKKLRIISALLALLTILSTFSFLVVLQTSAADATTEEEEEIPDYTKLSFLNVEDKLATMEKKIENDRYALYAEKWTGEVYCLDKATGKVLATNPWDAFSTGTTTAIKEKLLSQIIIKYTDTTGNTKEMTSYVDAALNEQIKIKSIKGGIRVEYTMGRSLSQYLVPRMIEKTSFETKILSKLPGGQQYIDSGYKDTSGFKRALTDVFYKYILYDPNDITNPERVIVEMQSKYPVTKKEYNGALMAVYVLSSDVVPREFNLIESRIKEYCSDYTYEELEKDHALTDYTGTSIDPALFRLALEYTLTDTGMSVRLPANGIRYDEVNYTLEEIQVLPYIGAGSNEFTGYNFIPDGSGAITRFEEFKGQSVNISGKMYGNDFAYKTITGSSREVMRIPVFGIVENAKVTRTITTTVPVETPETDHSRG